MKMLIGLAAGMTVVGMGYHLEGPKTVSGAAAPGPTPAEISHYSLLIAGNTVACRVTKGRELSEQISEIKLSQGCGEAFARLDKAALWREGPHGDVAFATKDGRTLVRFASGDGVAYESYRPSVPFISLVAER